MKQFLTSEQVEILNNSIEFALPPRVVSLGDLLEILPEVFDIDIIGGIFSIKLDDPVSWCPISDNKELDLNIAHAGQHITVYMSYELAKEGYLKECKDFLRANYKIIKSHEVELMKLRDLQLKFQKIVDDYENI